MQRSEIAVSWDPKVQDEFGSYWSFDFGWDNTCHQQQEDELVGLSFDDFYAIRDGLAAHLLTNIESLLNGRDCVSILDCAANKCLSEHSVPVVVAIPEGPWLPIAIAAVHELNKPRKICMRDNGDFRVSFVLTPMEPTEGVDRLAHMLADIRPALILTAADCDLERMETILQQLPSHRIRGSGDDTGRNCLLQVPEPKLLDVRQLDTTSTRYPADILTNPVVDSQLTIQEGETGISHIVFTSGSTGKPKGCISSSKALALYLSSKNSIHQVGEDSRVLLASTVSFDPCFSDVLATLQARGTLVITSRRLLRESLPHVLRRHNVTHVLCTPTMWSMLGDYSPADFPYLERIFLGGEAIPKSIVSRWARSDPLDDQSCCLYATYGVTEGCVYQTAGEIFHSQETHVGLPFPGINVKICDETNQDGFVERAHDTPGELVLVGGQIDALSGYLNRESPDSGRFGVVDSEYYYRTGDLAVWKGPEERKLAVLGRILGDDMVKINGVRLELGEIEMALLDDAGDGLEVVDGAIAKLWTSNDRKELVAYIVLSTKCLEELGISPDIPETGVSCSIMPLLTLLLYRCKRRAKVVPSSFVLLPRIPQSPTGKRSRQSLPPLDSVACLRDSPSVPLLHTYGKSGEFVSEQIVACLNLRNHQKTLVTVEASFRMLGGDSLAATRITRAVYAAHHNIHNGRDLGGQFGTLEGPFSAAHLLGARKLGDYVDWLDSHGICQISLSKDKACQNQSTAISQRQNKDGAELYDALVESTAKSFVRIASALIEEGADPNFAAHGGRLGKVGSRIDQRELFRSNPLHIACLNALPCLVSRLVEKGAKTRSPDASGLYPLHLAAARDPSKPYSEAEDISRRKCVQILLDAGVPVSMKDGNKQTVVHAAARAGNSNTLRYCLDQWIRTFPSGHASATGMDWRDRWARTAVHWAILNGHADCLQLLLEYGCDPNPPCAKNGRRSSAAVEAPQEMCNRLYGSTLVGEKITSLLQGSLYSPSVNRTSSSAPNRDRQNA